LESIQGQRMVGGVNREEFGMRRWMKGIEMTKAVWKE